MTSKNKPGIDFKLSAPALRALASAGIHSVKDFADWTEPDLKKLHGIGPNALTAIKKRLKEQKLSFRS